MTPRRGRPVRVLIMGGSQGARAINDALLAAAPALAAARRHAGDHAPDR